MTSESTDDEPVPRGAEHLERALPEPRPRPLELAADRARARALERRLRARARLALRAEQGRALHRARRRSRAVARDRARDRVDQSPTRRSSASSSRAYVRELRQVTADGAAQKNLLERVYRQTAGPAIGSLNDHFRAADPFLAARSGTVMPSVRNTLQLGDRTWQVEWVETRRTLEGKAQRRGDLGRSVRGRRRAAHRGRRARRQSARLQGHADLLESEVLTGGISMLSNRRSRLLALVLAAALPALGCAQFAKAPRMGPDDFPNATSARVARFAHESRVFP